MPCNIIANEHYILGRALCNFHGTSARKEKKAQVHSNYSECKSEVLHRRDLFGSLFCYFYFFLLFFGFLTYKQTLNHFVKTK